MPRSPPSEPRRFYPDSSGSTRRSPSRSCSPRSPSRGSSGAPASLPSARLLQPFPWTVGRLEGKIELERVDHDGMDRVMEQKPAEAGQRTDGQQHLDRHMENGDVLPNRV